MRKPNIDKSVDFDAFENNELNDSGKRLKRKPRKQSVGRPNNVSRKKTSPSRRAVNKNLATRGFYDSTNRNNKLVEFTDYNNLRIEDGVTYRYVGPALNDSRVNKSVRRNNYRTTSSRVVEFNDYNNLRIEDGVTYKYVGPSLNDSRRPVRYKNNTSKVVEFSDYSKLRIEDGVTYKYVGPSLNDSTDYMDDEDTDSIDDMINGFFESDEDRDLNDSYDEEDDDYFDDDDFDEDEDDFDDDDFDLDDSLDYDIDEDSDDLTDDNASYDGELTKYHIDDSVIHLPSYCVELVNDVKKFSKEIFDMCKIPVSVTDFIGLGVKERIKLGGREFIKYNKADIKFRDDVEVRLNNIWESFTTFFRKIGTLTEETALESNKKDLTLFIKLGEDTYYPVRLITLKDDKVDAWGIRLEKEFKDLLHFDAKRDSKTIVTTKNLPHGLKFK